MIRRFAAWLVSRTTGLFAVLTAMAVMAGDLNIGGQAFAGDKSAIHSGSGTTSGHGIGAVHGIAMHGVPKYPPDFRHFDYVNPAAPKGGTVTFAAIGSFDSLNPLIIKGVAATGLRAFVYESLMARSFDEPFSLYGLIAEKIETPADRGWVMFTLRRGAKFSDGSPVRVEDVAFSWKTLRDNGRPNHRSYYRKVTKIEYPGPRQIKFVLDQAADREMPLILGLMPVLSKIYFSQNAFDKTSLKVPLGSGPYIVEKIEPGKLITYRRDPNYWGQGLPVNKGRFNFGRVRYEYYRDNNAAFEAFKKGLVHVRGEDDPTRWAKGYDFPAVKQGRVRQVKFTMGLPSGMSALVFNTRRDVFKPAKVRQALGLMLDFEWINKNLYYGLYQRTQSFFDNSELSSHGRREDDTEKKLLAPFRDVIKPAIADGKHMFPVSDGSGRNRANRRKALALLKSAGFAIQAGRMKNIQTGTPLDFEIVVASRDQERLALSFAQSLKRIGVEARIRQVDSAQFQRRLQTYDFDMMPFRWYASLSPGNEQIFYWGSQSADRPGTRNYMGARSQAVDDMIAALLQARGRSEFVSAVRALDRALLSEDYVIPLFHLPVQWIGHWNFIRYPEKQTLWGMRIDTWWRDENQK